MKNWLLLLFVPFIHACSIEYPSPYSEAVPHELSSMSDEGRACAVAFSIGDSGYLGLGRRLATTKTLKDIYRYDIQANEWIFADTFPGIARINSIAQVVDGEAYIGLGYNPKTGWAISGYLKDFYKFNPATKSWTQMADFPKGYTDKAVSFVYDKEIYVLDGFESHLVNSSGFHNEVWKYSPASNSWTQLNDFPGHHRTSSTACTDGERVFMGTGWGTRNKFDWWEYIPSEDKWEQKADMPDKGRCNALSFSIDHRFFVAFGRYWAGDLTAGNLKKEIWEYDADKNRWYVVGEIPEGERENAIQFVIGNKAYVGMGENKTSVLNDLWSVESPILQQ